MKSEIKPTLIILAAGMGSRYGGLKQLDGVGPKGQTILEYSIYDAIRAGFGKIVCVIRSSFSKEFEDLIIKKFEGLIKICTVFQEMEAYVPIKYRSDREKPWGTGHAILCAKDEVNTPFAVINADDFYGRHSFQLIRNFLMEECDESTFGLVSYSLKNTLSPHGPVSRGVCEIDNSYHLKTVKEHMNIERNENAIIGTWKGEEVNLPENTWVSMNLWGFPESLFSQLEEQFLLFLKENANTPKSEFYIPFVVNHLLQTGQIKVKVEHSDDQWYGVTYREDRKGVESAVKNMTNSGLYPLKFS